MTETNEDKLNYIKNAPVGTIVAFDTDTQGVKSGAIIDRFGAIKMTVETEYGEEFVINYDEILWVKTGSRWPKWVYEKFKE